MSTECAPSVAVSGRGGLDTALLAWLAQSPPKRSEAARPAGALDPLDARDIGLSLRGKGEAFDRLVRRYQGEVARQMWRFTRDREEHVELVQEVFVAAWTSLHSYRGRGPFSQWLRRIAVRTGYAAWRRRKRERADPREDIEDLIDRQLAESAPQDAVAAAEAVHEVLAQLAPRDRLVLTLMYLEELSVAEVGDLTGWSRTMVKVQAWRARGRLRKLLEP